MRMRNIVFGIAVMVVLVVGALVLGYKVGQRKVFSPVEVSVQKYPLLSRRTLEQNRKDPLINFTSLRSDLQEYFKDNKLSGSLYFEYLHTGTEVRISGDEKQAAASLLKVPLAMEIYKAVELGKISEDQEITLKAEWLDSGFGTLYMKGAGYVLPVKEAVKIMLTDSDNTALRALADTISGVLLPNENVFTYLDASITQGEDLSVSIGARAYSSILKCLYFSCYVNNEHSDLLLRHLTETEFNNRMLAGINDKNITVAHKIGVFQETTQSDCGIVYLPGRPYIFCALIDGSDDTTTDNHIAELSRKVYNYVIKQ